MPDWIERVLKGVPISDASFSPDNSAIALISGNDVIIHLGLDVTVRTVIACDDKVVTARFQSNDELVTVTVNGEMAEWILVGNDPTVKTSRRVTAFPVKNVLWSEDSRESVWVLGGGSKDTTNNVSVLAADHSLQSICSLPTTVEKDQMALGRGFFTYCDQNEVVLIPLSEESDFKKQTYTYKSNIKGLTSEENERNVFVRIAANNDTIAVSSTIGQIHIWSQVTKGLITEHSRMMHWHKVSASMALTRHGGLVSAGAELVLCKWPLYNSGPPSLLPRLAAPVDRLVLSSDGSIVALLMEDNSVRIVLLSSMTVLTSIPSITWGKRSRHNIFMTDPINTRNIVLNGYAGSIQWLDVTDERSNEQLNFSLENAVDGDMSAVGIINTYHELDIVSFSSERVATLESLVNFQQDHKRLRFWQRGDAFHKADLMESMSVPADTSFISCCPQPIVDSDRVFIVCTNAGAINVYMPERSKWRNDNSRSTHWQNSQIRCVSSIDNGPVWASAHMGNNADSVIIWDVTNMQVREVIPCDGPVSSLDWASSRLVISSSKSISCWNIATGMLAWTVEQPLSVHCGVLGCFAWEKDQVIEFDVSSGRLLDSMRFSSSIKRVVVIEDNDSRRIIVAETSKGIAMLHSSQSMSKKTRTMGDEATPFSLLESVSQQGKKAPTASRAFARVPNALRLMDAPCHALPPLAHIAPIFINSCLAPPPSA